jgi:ribonuclease HI
MNKEYDQDHSKRLVEGIQTHRVGEGQSVRFSKSGTVYERSTNGGFVRLNPKPISRKRGKRHAAREQAKTVEIHRRMIKHAADEMKREADKAAKDAAEKAKAVEQISAVLQTPEVAK